MNLVNLWEKMDPDAYPTMEHLAGSKEDGSMSWSDYCKIPIGAAFTYLVHCGNSATNAAAGASELTACWIWRQNKVIYSFDKDLSSLLEQQAEAMKETEELPVDLILHLPYPCIYIQTPIWGDYDGFWIWIECDANTGGLELRTQWVVKNDDLSIGFTLHLLEGKTLKECVLDTANEPFRKSLLQLKEVSLSEGRGVLVPLQFLLYLLSDEPDMSERPKLKVVSSQKRQKNEPPPTIQKWEVGTRIGAAIRKYRRMPPEQRQESKSKGKGTSKRPHSRRGHWHHFWTGPKEGERKLVLKWVAPTFIHLDGPENSDNVVVYPVK